LSARIKFLANHVDLSNSEAVNTFISNLTVSAAYKHNLIKAYAYYAREYSLPWNRPRYKFERAPIRIPSEQEVNSIIENSSRRYSVIFTLLKETGCMPYELSKISLKDLDLDRALLSVTGYKGHSSRAFKLKSQTMGPLKWYIKQYGNKEPLFPSSNAIGKAWRKARAYTARQSPSVRSIHLYHLRHLFASSTYHKYRDPILLMQLLGHKKLERVMTYIQLLGAPNDEDFICKATKSLNEAKSLIESGFEYVCDLENYKLFRKRK
jgi:integrase